MLERLNSIKQKSVLTKYEKSVNELYDMFCEMKDKPKSDISIYDKAAQIDECYGSIKVDAPSKYIGIRRMIIKDYRAFNIDYRRKTQPKNTFTEEFVANELMSEHCQLISPYLCSNEFITYEFEGKKYKVTFNQWKNKGYRPHKGFYGDGLHWKDVYERSHK